MKKVKKSILQKRNIRMTGLIIRTGFSFTFIRRCRLQTLSNYAEREKTLLILTRNSSPSPDTFCRFPLGIWAGRKFKCSMQYLKYSVAQVDFHLFWICLRLSFIAAVTRPESGVLQLRKKNLQKTFTHYFLGELRTMAPLGGAPPPLESRTYLNRNFCIGGGSAQEKNIFCNKECFFSVLILLPSQYWLQIPPESWLF